jgi:hypothetical protein
VQQQLRGRHQSTVLIVDINLSSEIVVLTAMLQVTPSTLSVRLTRAEKIAGPLREVEVPLSAVRDAEVIAEPLRDVHGLRAPGLAVPGIWKVGTWRRPGDRTLVCVRKGQPALRVRLEGQRYGTLLVGADDAAAVAVALTTPH